MEEGETEKQREGRIRGEKATDATCLSHRYPDYWKMRRRKREAACQFIRAGRTEQNRICVYVCALNLSLLPTRTEQKCTCG